MNEYNTPGVYINENNAFGNSRVEAETAIPVFIGLTEKALDGNKSLLNKPVRIASMTEYDKYFGRAKTHIFNVTVGGADNGGISVESNGTKLQAKLQNGDIICSLYYHMTMFFANGGSTCYIVSLGDYKTGKIDKDVIGNIIVPELRKVEDITMILVPEVANDASAIGVYQDLLSFCENKKCFAILDIPTKYSADVKGNTDIEKFRNAIGTTNLQYAAAYYPWLETSVLSDNDIDGMTLFFNASPDQDKYIGNDKLDKFIVKVLAEIEKAKGDDDKQRKLRNDLHNFMLQNWPAYKLLADKVKTLLNHLPPSAAIAGVYAMVDRTRGVWKAPANVSVNYVIKPAMVITDDEQHDLYMPMNGKAINPIRTFPGEGIKVWGARTLDGNSNNWHYINVRRTISFLETSIKNVARSCIFGSMHMQCIIENFLHSVWKRGGLVGYYPEEAYEVHVGIGDNMTAEDLQEGIVQVRVLVAISFPAEFIEITFQQQMQK